MACEFILHILVLIFDLQNWIQEPDLFFFNVSVFKFCLVKLSDQTIYFLSISLDSIKVFLLDMLYFNLDLLVLIQQVSILVFELVMISGSVFHFVNFSSEFVDEKFLVLTASLWRICLSSEQCRSRAWANSGASLSLSGISCVWSVHIIGCTKWTSCLVLACMAFNPVSRLILVLPGASRDRWSIWWSALAVSVFFLTSLARRWSSHVWRLWVVDWSFTRLRLYIQKWKVAHHLQKINNS